MNSLAVVACGWLLAAPPGNTEPPVDYLRDIKPLFAKHCVGCHGPSKQRSDLRLDTAAHAMEGGGSGAVIVPGKSMSSKLIKAITGAAKVTPMPPPEQPPLTAKEIALLKAWVDQGAKAPTNEVAGNGKSKSDHWAFKPPVRHAPPPVKKQEWVRNPIDQFILARLEKEKVEPSPAADRVTLIRRLSLDLLGLPPSLKDIDDFVNDQRTDAYERLVDKLLDSPHYGERWARHWLDLARYADSNGFNIDAPRTIWPYRDWVVGAFNRDLPFDRFVIEQIAGDLLPDATTAQKIATGFQRNTLLNQEGGIDLEQFRVESVVDRVNTTGSVFLGLTVGCAQCHDHKFDPISQREYYQLFAFYNNCDEPTLPLPTPAEEKQVKALRAQQQELLKKLQGLDNATAARQKAWDERLTPFDRLRFPVVLRDILDKPVYQRTTAEKQTLSKTFRLMDQLPQFLGHLGDPLSGPLVGGTLLGAHFHLLSYRSTIEKQVADLKNQEPKFASTLVLKERPTPRESHIHIKGDFLRKGKKVAPATLEVVQPALSDKSSQVNDQSNQRNRVDLAKWLVDPSNPLTARVFMNRVWQHYFGLGLVETENDFGVQGTPPSHPELLDWLATEFMSPSTQRGEGVPTAWSIKAMHRLILNSATYRQMSKARPDLALADPRNRLLARQNRLRLEAEVVRDVSLAASGLLSSKLGGPPVYPPQPEGVFAFTQVQREWKASEGEDRFRRGMYTHFWRSAPHPALMAFDAPESTATCTRRNRSNTPLQALTLLNDKAFFEFAQGLSLRILREAKGSDADRVRHAFRLCLSRPPSAREEDRLVRLLSDLQRELRDDAKEVERLTPTPLPKGMDRVQAAAWTLTARVLLNLDEFITRE